MKLNSIVLALTTLVSLFVIAACDNTGDPPVVNKSPGIYIKVTDSLTGAALDSAIVRTCYSFGSPDAVPDDGNWMVYPNPSPVSEPILISYEIKNNKEFKKITITDIKDSILRVLFEGNQVKGGYALVISPTLLEELVPPYGFYYITCDTGALKTKKMIMIFDMPYIIDDSEFSFVVGTRLSDKSGDVFLPYDLYSLSESGTVITKTNDFYQETGYYQFKKEAVVEISKEKYKTQKIVVPLIKDKVHEVNVKLEPTELPD